jgi:hypothetical protein
MTWKKQTGYDVDDDEIEQHLDDRYRGLIASGMSGRQVTACSLRLRVEGLRLEKGLRLKARGLRLEAR